ncbi:unnamed protein product [Prorocentrum cordatum]|uniref:Uncharacterized protein n=1 Tax=Prorocentrum cordatum TaxID=2364126 RepID=A0ABN9UB13_9DINO|nr:unnamed protein product [Polarella glacialis]|mmetsp:Transcript_90610/g.236018  ORF Transcript_90610/g.236018 Transcript_90610/m.236018 type:complete len:148 (-) Transcript_90610:498-941(-)
MSGDGSSIKYGRQEKKMKPGVLCQEIADFESSKFHRNTPTKLAPFLAQKGATDTYNKFKEDVLANKKWQGAFNWKGVQKVTVDSKGAFAAHGIDLFLCNRRMASGPEGGGGGFAQWFEFVDTTIQKDYTPDEAFDPALAPCCACSVM